MRPGPNEPYPEELKERIRQYYRRLYTAVGLADINYWVEERMKEEETEARRVAEVEHHLNLSFGGGQRHLIVGAGTGGLAVVLGRKGCRVYGIEPEEEANRIVRRKAEFAGMPPDNFLAARAEGLPFAGDSFDFIHCFTVLEHVADIPAALAEMIRVIRPGGYLYVNSPDYRFPFERHYKIHFPTFLPKIFGYPYLWLRGRPRGFFRNLQYISEKNINRILYRQPVVWQRVYRQMPAKWESPWQRRSWRLFTLRLNIPMTQEIFIRKTVRSERGSGR